MQAWARQVRHRELVRPQLERAVSLQELRVQPREQTVQRDPHRSRAEVRVLHRQACPAPRAGRQLPEAALGSAVWNRSFPQSAVNAR